MNDVHIDKPFTWPHRGPPPFDCGRKPPLFIGMPLLRSLRFLHVSVTLISAFRISGFQLFLLCPSKGGTTGTNGTKINALPLNQGACRCTALQGNLVQLGTKFGASPSSIKTSDCTARRYNPVHTPQVFVYQPPTKNNQLTSAYDRCRTKIH